MTAPKQTTAKEVDEVLARLPEIEARANAATELLDNHCHLLAYEVMRRGPSDDAQAKVDYQYSVAALNHARTDIPALCAAVRDLAA